MNVVSCSHAAAVVIGVNVHRKMNYKLLLIISVTIFI